MQQQQQWTTRNDSVCDFHSFMNVRNSNYCRRVWCPLLFVTAAAHFMLSLPLRSNGRQLLFAFVVSSACSCMNMLFAFSRSAYYFSSSSCSHRICANILSRISKKCVRPPLLLRRSVRVDTSVCLRMREYTQQCRFIVSTPRVESTEPNNGRSPDASKCK